MRKIVVCGLAISLGITVNVWACSGKVYKADRERPYYNMETPNIALLNNVRLEIYEDELVVIKDEIQLDEYIMESLDRYIWSFDSLPDMKIYGDHQGIELSKECWDYVVKNFPKFNLSLK